MAVNLKYGQTYTAAYNPLSVNIEEYDGTIINVTVTRIDNDKCQQISAHTVYRPEGYLDYGVGILTGIIVALIFISTRK